MNQRKEASLVQREVAANAAGGIGGVPPLSFLSPGGEPPRPFLSPASCVIWPIAPGVINHHPEHRSKQPIQPSASFGRPDYRAAGNTVS